MADQLIRETEAPLGVPPSPVPQVWDPTSNSYVKLYGSGNAMNTNATIIKEAGLYTVHHDAATAPSAGAVADVTGYNTVAIQVLGSFNYARVACEGSVDGTNYFMLPLISVDGIYMTTHQWIQAARSFWSGLYYCCIAGCSKFRVRLLTFSGTSITIVSRAVTLTDTSFLNRANKGFMLLANNQNIPAASSFSTGFFIAGGVNVMNFYVWSLTNWPGRLKVYGDYAAMPFLMSAYVGNIITDVSFNVTSLLYKVSLTDINVYNTALMTVYLYNLSSSEQSAYMAVSWI